MLKHSTSLGTLFGRSVCPLFLATALVVAPGVARGADIIIDFDTNETNGDATTPYDNDPGPGDTFTVEEGVTMDIDEDGTGVFVQDADGVTIINNGSIYASGTENNCGYNQTYAGCAGNEQNDSGVKSFGYALGIWVERSDNALVINNGLISASDHFGYGILVNDSDNAVVINNGVVYAGSNAASDEQGYGLVITNSSNATLVNEGSVYLADDGKAMMQMLAYDDAQLVFGQDTARTGNLMVNNGLLQSSNVISFGMVMWGQDPNQAGRAQVGATDINGDMLQAILNANGDVIGYQTTTVASEQYFFYSTDDYTYILNSSMYNYGNIEILATGASHRYNTQDQLNNVATGMYAWAHAVNVYNYGHIYIGPIGKGMAGHGTENNLFNYGTILMDQVDATYDTSFSSIGIESYVNPTVFFNTGTDPSAGGTDDDTYVLRDAGYRNTVVNAGSIIMKGPDAVGVALTGNPGHDFYNYGRIEAENGYSIRIQLIGNYASYSTVNLLDGSILVGDIILGDGSDGGRTRFFLGDGLNAAIRFYEGATGVEPGVLPSYSDFSSPNGFVLIDDTIYVVDLDGYAQQDQVSWSLFSMVQDAVDQGTASRRPAGNFAFHGHDKDDGFEMWATMFADWVYDPGDDDVSYLDTNADHTAGYLGYSAGTIVGVNKDALSFYLGAAYSDVSSEEDVDYTTHSGTLFGGIAGTIAERLSVSLTAGAAYNQTNRDMADSTVSGGIDKASANYASFFLSPSLLINGPISGSSLRVNYLGAWHQAHDFSFDGGTQIDVDSRFSNVFGAQLQMAHKLPLTNETFPTRIRYGVEASYADGQAIGYNLMGTDFETDYDSGFSARGFAALEVGPTFIKAGYGTDEQVSINAGLTLRF